MGEEAEYLYEQGVDAMAQRYLRERAKECSSSQGYIGRLQTKICNQRETIRQLQIKIQRLEDEIAALKEGTDF